MRKNEAAVALARARWRGKTAEEKAEQGKLLAKGRENIPPKVRSEIARKAVLARWAKRKGQKETKGG